MRKKYIAGNWKMNNTLSETVQFISDFKKMTQGMKDVEIGIAPAFVNLSVASELLKDTGINVIAQNVFHEDKGAFTGEISPDMLSDIGVESVILGHSERRHVFMESDETINRKVKKAFEKDMKVILCIGEKLQEREQGITNIVLEKQLKNGLAGVDEKDVGNMVIAYEPVWAIGTGKNAVSEDAQSACAFVRKTIADMYSEGCAEKVRIQYGGSVKPENAAEYMACTDIDGALVGGASLKADTFFRLIKEAVK
ncbi:MAG: triose-phosphate isomerase [Candidatus Muiribacteriaceae bacterium]